MNFVHSLFPRHILRFFIRKTSSTSKTKPKVRIVSLDDDSHLQFSFRYSNSPNLNLKAPKDENVQTVLTRIKLMAQLQLKKEELQQIAGSKNQTFENGESVAKEIDVFLMQNGTNLDMSMSNCDVWPRASILTIGEVIYEVNYNTPTVKSLRLPDFIVSGCVIRPQFNLECASLEHSTFTWFRSVTEDCATKLMNDKSNKVLKENGTYWLRVYEGFLYYTCTEDIGCLLKVVCTPKLNKVVGPEYSIQSEAVVEAPPDGFPFEERQDHTKTFCDDDKIRCLSYNILANVYVDRNRFPYASKKARDNYYRKQILLKELVGYKSDIICLQEVQGRIFEYDLLPVLKKLGYTGFYTKKGSKNEGVAMFYRPSKFKEKVKEGIMLNKIIKEKHIYLDLLNKVSGNYKDMAKLLLQDTPLQVLCLEHVNLPGYKILVANTHLYSNKDMPEVRLIQAAVCTHYIEHIMKQENLETPGVLFCGDFNSKPSSSTYDFIMSGAYKCCPSWQSNSNSSLDTVLKHNLCFDSACGTPEYTNYTQLFAGCLDYIFYSKDNLKVTEMVPMPRHEDVVCQVGLPNEYFPSDHIALVCTLEWKNS